jgi:hypothetical protein
MKDIHASEENLIEYAMGTSANIKAIRAHLDICESCRDALSSINGIRSTLQDEALPEPNVEKHWDRLHRQIRPAPYADKRQRFHWAKWIAIAAPACVLIAVLGLLLRPRHEVRESTRAISANGSPASINGQLTGIERLLTLVRHTDGPLDSTVRSEAVTLLGTNSACIQAAGTHGEVGIAQVLENSGILLANIAHPTGTSTDQTSRNTELDLDATLLQVRILLQNEVGNGAEGTS